MEEGMAVILFGPMDFAIGIFDRRLDGYIHLKPGCVTSRNIPNLTAVVASGEPHGAEYVSHPRGHRYSVLACSGWSELPSFDPKKWPARTR